MKIDQTEAPARRLIRWIVFLAAVAIVTAVMFGPSSGFHHQYGFGRPVMYMVLNGEDPDPESFQIDGMEVVFNPAAFAALFFVWLMIIGFVFSLVWQARRADGSDDDAVRDRCR